MQPQSPPPPPPPQMSDFNDISKNLATLKEKEWILQEKQKDKFFHDINIMATAAFQQGNYKRAARLYKLKLDKHLADMKAVNL